MNANLKKGTGALVKQAASIAWLVSSRTVGFAVLGVVLNLIAAVVVYSEVYALFSAGGWQNIVLAAGVVLALLLFPIGYALLGKAYGVQLAVYHILSKQKTFLINYLAVKLSEKIEHDPKWQAKMRESGVRKTFDEMLPKYFDKLDNMNWAVRLVFDLVLDSVDVVNVIKSALDEQADTPGDFDWPRFTRSAGAKLDERIDEDFLTVDLTFFWILLALNIGGVAALKFS